MAQSALQRRQAARGGNGPAAIVPPTCMSLHWTNSVSGRTPNRASQTTLPRRGGKALFPGDNDNGADLEGNRETHSDMPCRFVPTMIPHRPKILIHRAPGRGVFQEAP